jgi:hypothetical protein
MWESRMRKPDVLVVAGDKEHCHEVCSQLEELDYAATSILSLKDLEEGLQKDPEVVVILELDSVPVNNQFLRGLRKMHPQHYHCQGTAPGCQNLRRRWPARFYLILIVKYGKFLDAG